MGSVGRMEIGLGLPNPVPGTPGHALLDYARRAEERGFVALATIDRIAYPSYNSLTTLAAAAGATSRIRLMPNILLAPLYPAALLAKAAASLDQLSGGRLTLGLAPGARPDDYVVMGRDFATRGRDFDTALEIMHRAWRGEPVLGSDKPIGPTPVNDQRVPILIGGYRPPAIRRVVRWGAGCTVGGAGPQQAGALFDRVRSAWKQAGRHGEPRLAALSYFSVGDDVADESMSYLRDYYSGIGPFAEQIATGAPRSPAAIRQTVAAFADVGCTELYFDATSKSPDQVDRLADIVF
jgi:alkanesulfonate monooxygenase SsuD/methylene tetrahydromethanopterin reductase-like flavin-dependent oxidoreductase (luciferase family)